MSDLAAAMCDMLQANAEIKGWVRCAAPLHLMHTSMADALAATAAAAAAGQPSAAAAAEPASAPPPARSSGAAAKPAHAGKGAKQAAAAQSAAEGPATSAGPPAAAAAAASTCAAMPVAGASEGCSEAGQGAPSTHIQPDKLPQPAAYVMLPSEVRYQGSMTRAVFRMDYRDSDLLHVLEDSVRQHNAIVLGLAPPPSTNTRGARSHQGCRRGSSGSRSGCSGGSSWLTAGKIAVGQLPGWQSSA